MKKSIKFIAIASCLFSVLAASNQLMASPQKVRKKLIEMMPKSERSPEKSFCADFSGTWTGSCTDSMGDQFSSNLKVDQFDCGSFRVTQDGDTYHAQLGNVTKYGETSFEYLSTIEILARPTWDIARRKLTLNMSGAFQSQYSNSSGMIETNTTYELVDGQLKSRFEQRSFASGRVGEDQFVEECVFSK